jgi:hypothetical protein
MSRFLGGSYLCAALLAGACSFAYADRAAAPPPPPLPHDQALAIAPEAVRAKYNVDITDENGDSLQTFAQKGRYYVLGGAGERYIVHVTNPTAARIEAVITVDGLDVIDGEAGDLHKRGYVIPAYGDVRIEGFRTSTTDVATFRFSAVAESYAQRKGKGRNVGVVAVAIFEEVPPPAEPVMIQPTEPEDPRHWYYDNLDNAGEDGAGDSARPTGGASRGHGAATDDKEADEPAPPPPAKVSSAPGAAQGGSGSAGAPARPDLSRDRSDCCTPRTSRPGLGTEFGETRYSSVSWTKFVRASSKPAAVAELRYNDAAGLMALGIQVQPMPDSDELGTRETADPFPGDDHFARPPAGVR